MFRKILAALMAIAALGLGSTAMAKHGRGHGGSYSGGVYSSGGYGYGGSGGYGGGGGYIGGGPDGM